MSKTYYTADLVDIVADLAKRVYNLEQQGGYSYGTSSDGTVSNTFPNGIIIGSGSLSAVVNYPISDPTGLTISAGTFFNEAFIDVSWTADSTITSTEVQWAKKNIDGTYQNYHADYTNGTALRINAVLANQTYGVRIVSRNNIGVASNYVPAYPAYVDIHVPGDSTLPAAPTGVQSAAGADAMVVAWNENTEIDMVNGAGLYQVQISSNSGFTTIVRDQRTAATVISFSDLTVNALYYVRVRAIDASGNASPWTVGGSTQAGAVNGLDILARSIVAASIQAGTITAFEIHADTITANEIAADAITASELAAMSIGVGKYIRSQGYVAGSAGWNIDASGSAEFNNVVVRGTILASTISGSQINGGTITSSVIQGGLFTTSVYNSGARLTLESLGGSLIDNRLSFYTGLGEEDASGYLAEYVDFVTGCPAIQLRTPDFMSGARTTCGSLTMFGSNNDGSVQGYGVYEQGSHFAFINMYVEVNRFGTLNWDGVPFRSVGTNGVTGIALYATGGGITDHVVTLGLQSSEGPKFKCLNSDNSNYVSIQALSFIVSSEARLKRDIRHIQEVDVLARLKQLRPVAFKREASALKGLTGALLEEASGDKLGFIAEEVNTVFPEIVTVDQDGTPLGVDYGALTSPLVHAVQELLDRVEQLEEHIDAKA